MIDLSGYRMTSYSSKYYPDAKYKKIMVPYILAEKKVNTRNEKEIFDYFEEITKAVQE